MKHKRIGRIDITVAWIIAVAVCLIYRAQNLFGITALEDWGI